MAALALDYDAAVIDTTRNVTVMAARNMRQPAVDLAHELLKGGRIQTLHDRVAGFFTGASPINTRLVIAPLSPNHTGGGGAYHTATIPDIYCDAQLIKGTKVFKWDFTAALYVCELTELFATAKNPGWEDSGPGAHSGYDHGEALSVFMGETQVPKTLDHFEVVPAWMNSTRPDWVSRFSMAYSVQAIGCADCFLHYLHTRLKYPIPAIIDAMPRGGVPTLEAVFRKLTGRQGGYAEMMKALDAKYPPGTLVGPGIANDDLFD